MRNLEGYGNILNEAHRKALMCIVGRFTMLASGTHQGRHAYDLGCGCGKTQAVVAWCAELWHQRQPYSVLVCQTQVEHLCELKRQLIANGVPGDEVGLVHSYGDKASLPPTTGNGDKRIVLATHQNVRTGQNIDEVNIYQGNPRDLVIWDESLLASDHRSVEKMQVEMGRGYLRPMVDNGRAKADLQETVAYLDEAWKVFDAELARQHQGNGDSRPKQLTLRSLTPEDQARMIKSVPGGGHLGAVRELLAISQAPLRVVTSNQGGGGLIKYDVVVPRELRNVAVLDASWAIRDLERLDKTIKDDPNFNGDVKSYSTVTVHHLIGASGRQAMTDAFAGNRGDRKISKEIARVVKDIPEDQGVLLFTFKPTERRQLDMAEKLRGDLRAEGVDVDAKLASGKPRFAWLTWGRETSTSEFQYCRNVIFAGVLHRSDVDLAGAIAGQQDDLTVDIGHAEIAKVKRSEIAHSLLQAMNRGACRNTVNGVAEPMQVWLIHHDVKVRDLLSDALPGVVWKNWERRHLQTRTHKMEDAVKAITEALASLPGSLTNISIRRLKDAAGALDVSPRTWTKALQACLEGGSGWELQLGAVSARNPPRRPSGDGSAARQLVLPDEGRQAGDGNRR